MRMNSLVRLKQGQERAGDGWLPGSHKIRKVGTIWQPQTFWPLRETLGMYGILINGEGRDVVLVHTSCATDDPNDQSDPWESVPVHMYMENSREGTR